MGKKKKEFKITIFSWGRRQDNGKRGHNNLRGPGRDQDILASAKKKEHLRG